MVFVYELNYMYVYNLYIRRWSSDGNKSVQQSILKEILSQVDYKFSESDVKGMLQHFLTLSLH